MGDRDDFTTKQKHVLARRAGGMCSNPNCLRPTTGPHSDPERAVTIGVAAHISAASAGGPRYDPTMLPNQRSSLENGIWLCQNCAHLIDSTSANYSPGTLIGWKAAREAAAADALAMSVAVDIGNHAGVRVRKMRDVSGDAVSPTLNWSQVIRFNRTDRFPCPASDNDTISIPRVELDNEKSNWFRLSKLSGHDGIHMPNDFDDDTVGSLLRIPWRAFHQQQRAAGHGKSNDPVLDVTFLNDSNRSLVIEGLRIRPLAAWTLPKGYPMPSLIPVHASYSMTVDFTREWSGLDFSTPWIIPSGAPWRFLLRLDDFAMWLHAVRANESLLSVGVLSDTVQVESGPIYLGVF